MAITVEDIKGMPTKYKVIAFVLAFLLLGYFYYFFFFSSALEKKTKLTEKLETLEQKVREKEKIASQINKHKQEIAELQKQLAIAMAKLPEQKEIPGLLTSVTQAGTRMGLEFLLFQPMSPIAKDFYADIPVKISILGGFHEIVVFYERVAKLSRIINVEDISMRSGGRQGEKILLTVNCVMKTYMFVERKDENKKGTQKKKR